MDGSAHRLLVIGLSLGLLSSVVGIVVFKAMGEPYPHALEVVAVTMSGALAHVATRRKQ